MFYRNILDDFKKWANKTDRKPLIIRGARQVGKTTVVEMFAEKFQQYIYLNLEKKFDREIFEKTDDINEIIRAIFLLKNKLISVSNTLIFIDEIQNSAKAIKMLRYFYEEQNEYYVIAAGSLLEFASDYKTSFPVGRVEYLNLYPFTFSEFLNAQGEQGLLEALKEIPFPYFAHEKALKKFYRYTLIGGMPEVVKNYIEKGDLVELGTIYDSLLISYMDDVEKYAKNNTQADILRHVINSCFEEAGKRIKFEGFGKSNYKFREMKESFLTLERAMLIRLQYPSVVVKPPITFSKNKSPKLMVLDTGLVNYFVGLQKDLFATDNIDDIYGGKIAEHIVGQELLAHSKSKIHKPIFWVREKRQSTAEVDFLIQYNGLVIPVEVKSGKAGRLRSLMQFIDNAPHNFAVRIYSGLLSIDKVKTLNGKEYKLLNLPLYLTGALEKYLEWFIGNNKA